ncbi:MAG: ATP-NAD kinase family protein [Synergistaceae bacterium]|jgi:predicted polyphosphate/ATP-dependent NAD kinase|nr:ATP-NAD kinase family protein [Synergistaceae bacterium]
MRLGFIVNPLAGAGGPLAMKGSDHITGVHHDTTTLDRPALDRALTFLRTLADGGDQIEFLTYGGEMGEASLAAAGVSISKIRVVGAPHTPSAAADTQDAVRAMMGVDCLAFVGGDGTARDICSAMGEAAAVWEIVPITGVPAGVKMHSAVFARTPADAGRLVMSLLSGAVEFRMGEVMDIDEAAFREGRVSARLYGYMRVPAAREMQRGKSASRGWSGIDGAARSVAREMKDGVLYVVGPGTSTQLVFEALGLGSAKTLLGVDVLLNGKVIAKDADYQTLKALTRDGCRVIITPIGGQGCLFGRGNQQIGPEVIRRMQELIVIASPEKLLSIPGMAFYNDTGDPELDAALRGYIRVRTGDSEETVFRCE